MKLVIAKPVLRLVKYDLVIYAYTCADKTYYLLLRIGKLCIYVTSW